MPDLQKLHENKNKIISSIKTKGPSFPTRISRETGIPPLFAAAYLSELVRERKLKLSNIKIGSSPLYYIEGQEQDLEKFTDHLNHKEKEAFFLLKKSQILEDEKQEPAIRVAIRKIKDFAFPITVRINGESRLFWKFFSLSSEKIKPKIQESISAEKTKTTLPFVESKIKKPIEPIFTEEIIIKKTKTLGHFLESVKSHLSQNNINILEEISNKKKEFISKIQIDSNFGKQDYLLTSKDKKKITENDLTLALQKAQAEKMPAFLISTGEPDKKAAQYLEQWRNLIKFEKLAPNQNV